jgi:hypothetical protein
VPHIARLLIAPLALYALVVLGEVAALAVRGNPLRSLGALPLIVLTHVLYGCGFWRGLFTRLRPSGTAAPVEVVVERIHG